MSYAIAVAMTISVIIFTIVATILIVVRYRRDQFVIFFVGAAVILQWLYLIIKLLPELMTP